MNKKIFIITITCLAFSTLLNAQNVGINTTGATPNASAQLDLNTGNTFTSPNGKGLLIPNIALTGTGDATTIASPATSLFVYNTATAGSGSTGITPGFYYWDGAKWVAFSGSGSKNWALTGNSGTTASSSAIGVAANNNFIGTLDAQNFVVTTNGKEVGRFLSSGTENFVVNNITAATNDIFSSYTSVAGGNAIKGYNTYSGTSGGNGVYGTTTADNGNGVKAVSTTTTTSTSVIPTGVYGQAAAAHGIGAFGQNTNTNGTGVVGSGNGLASLVTTVGSGGSFYGTTIGAYAIVANTTGITYGFEGVSPSDNGVGVIGISSATVTTGAPVGVVGQSASAVGVGILGISTYTGTANTTIGIFGLNNAPKGTAIFGYGNEGASYLPIANWIGTVSPIPGMIGSSNECGILGDLENTSSQGSSYFPGDNYAGVVGSNSVSATSNKNFYHFGVEGYMAIGGTIAKNLRVGGVLGTSNILAGGNQQWGALFYNNSGGNTYSLYYTSGASSSSGASGRMSSNNNTSSVNTISSRIGMGGYGGLYGGWIRGEVYGLNVKGDRYAMYVDGKTFTNDVIGQITTTAAGEKVVNYAVTAETAQVSSSGTASFSRGACFVPFNDNFKKSISNTNDLIINITPYGTSQGLYISEITADGFYVKENNNGTSTLRFAWSASGIKAGAENLVTPEELLDKNYDKNMTGVMSDESPTNTAQPVWWDGTKLRFEELPATTELTPANNSAVKIKMPTKVHQKSQTN